MTTAVENHYVFAHLDGLEPAPRIAPGGTDDGRRRFDVRRHLGITAFGIQAFSAPGGVRVISEHDETLLGEAGQSSSGARRRSKSTARSSRRRPAPLFRFSRARGGRRQPQRTARPSSSSAQPRARRTSPLRRKRPRRSPPTTQETSRRRWRSSASLWRRSPTMPWRTSTLGASRHERDVLTRRSSTSGGRSR